jgi:hypothetical protein
MRLTSFMTSILIAVLLCSLAMATPQNTVTPAVVDGSKCGEVTAALDRALHAARDAKFLVIIARPGRGERGAGWAHRRLYNVRTYIIDCGLPPERVVTAVGDRVDGPARVELYALDRVLAVITTGRYKDVIVSIGCEGEVFSYYPWKAWWEKHHRRSKGPSIRRAPN